MPVNRESHEIVRVERSEYIVNKFELSHEITSNADYVIAQSYDVII